MAAGDTFVNGTPTQPSLTGRPWPGRWGPWKISSTVSGRPISRLSVTSASKNDRAWRGASNTRVRETSTCRIDSSHQYPAARSWSVSGSGRILIQRSKNTPMVPGPSRSQIACNASGSAQMANPLDSSVNPIPA